MKYPQEIREIGFRHRRAAGYKYVDLPALFDNLTLSRRMWMDFKGYWHKYIDVSPNKSEMDSLLTHLELQLKKAWLNYFGPDAEQELLLMHKKDIFEMEKKRDVLIIMDYDYKDLESYRGAKVMLMNGQSGTKVFFSEDPCKDYNDALRYAQRDMEADEIIQHDSCLMFTLDSKGKYTFNLKEEMVRIERE